MENRLQQIKKYGIKENDLTWLIEQAEKLEHHQNVLNELKKSKNRAVKKTLTIPKWLDEIAIEEGINFSQTLQEALKEKLGL